MQIDAPSTITESVEKDVFSNQFGTVTTKRLVFFRKKHWWSGSSREDIPLQHITSIRVDIKRHIILGILSILIGLPCLAAHSSAGVVVIGLIFIALAIVFFMGSPKVIVNTSGNDLRVSAGAPGQNKNANEFADALRSRLFK